MLEINELQVQDIDDDLCALVAEWRNRSIGFFFDQRKVDSDSARRYLDNKVSSVADKFFTVKLSGLLVGHVGLKNLTDTEGELDNFMVGSRVPTLNVADEIEKFMLDYAGGGLGLKRLYLNLLSHNVLVRRLHEANNFRRVSAERLHESSSELGKVLSKCPSNRCEEDHSMFRAELWEIDL